MGQQTWKNVVNALPEDAWDLVPCSDVRYHCRCWFDEVPDPDDAADAAYFGRAQRRKFALVKYVGNCPYGNHAKRYLDNLWRRTDNEPC